MPLLGCLNKVQEPNGGKGESRTRTSSSETSPHGQDRPSAHCSQGCCPGVRKGRDMNVSKSDRWKIFRTTFLAFCAVLALGLGSASVASADPPTREPISLPTEPFLFTDTLGNNPCGFPVLLAITTNKEIVTTFTQRSGVTSIHTTGALKVRLTNTVTGESIDRNISGPILATVNGDGSTTQHGAGLALWVFDPGVAPDLPRLTIVKGKTVSVLGPGTAFEFISRTGSYEDICATLAA